MKIRYRYLKDSKRYEIVDNAIDEALAGYCDKILVELLDDGVIRVTDNGRGIPVGVNSKTGLPAVTVVFTVLHAGGKFGGDGYKIFVYVPQGFVPTEGEVCDGILTLTPDDSENRKVDWSVSFRRA